MLGAGGMGEVYRARDTRLDRDVAIKVLPPSLARDPERLTRFETEAKAAGQLNHPNVLGVYDIGSHDGSPFLVTEVLEGQTLRAQLEEGGPPPRKAIDIASQVALGLSAAHEKGVVHRDLKPENLFVTREGRVKILDFGLARLSAPSGGGESTATTPNATEPGSVLGTVGYMSPEQVRGKPADARSDIFAFGAILYELLSGQRAFQRDSAADTMAAILKEDPPDLSGVSRSIPPGVDRLVQRCLDKNPDERFQSARDLAFALDVVSGSSATSLAGEAPMFAAPVKPRGWAIVLLAACGLVVALAVGYLGGRSGASAPGAGSGDVRLRQLTFNGGDATQPALAPDGESFVFVSRAGGNADIYLQRVGGDNATDLTKDTPDDNTEPAFSPDGKFIAFRSERNGGGLFIMGATGESVRRIADSGFNPAWSPDGREIVFSTEPVGNPGNRFSVASLYRVDATTGAKRPIFKGDAVQPSWSPNGRLIAFWGLPRGTGRRVIYTIGADGGQPKVLVDDASYNWCPKWSRDGRFVYFASDRLRPMGLWRIEVDPTSGAPRGEPERVASGTEAYFGLSEFAGQSFVFPSTAAVGIVERFAVDPRAGKLTSGPQVVLRTSRVENPWGAQPSPDGRYLALVINDVSEDLAVIRSDGTGFTRLTNDPYRDRGPTWAPDSDRIYFHSDRSGQYEIWSVRKDGSGLEQVTKHAGAAANDPRPSPDGRTLLVDAAEPTESGLIDLTRPLADRKVQWLGLHESPESGPLLWSRDGRFLAGRTISPPGILVYSLSDKSVRSIPVKDVNVVAMLDDRTILGVGVKDDRLRVVDLATETIRIGDQIPPNAMTVLLAADLKTLYVTHEQTVTNLWMLSLGGQSRPAAH